MRRAGRCARSARCKTYDEPQTTADGKTIWLRTFKTPLKDRQGQLIGLLGIYHDIGDQRTGATAALPPAADSQAKPGGQQRQSAG
ncbi:MAG: PAS domain-containing protein [Rhodoferax sp.]|jgi:hypothetical protein|nr:PAS domain-containing protein [Rhodoferax sp.]